MLLSNGLGTCTIHFKVLQSITGKMNISTQSFTSLKWMRLQKLPNSQKEQLCETWSCYSAEKLAGRCSEVCSAILFLHVHSECCVYIYVLLIYLIIFNKLLVCFKNKTPPNQKNQTNQETTKQMREWMALWEKYLLASLKTWFSLQDPHRNFKSSPNLCIGTPHTKISNSIKNILKGLRCGPAIGILETGDKRQISGNWISLREKTERRENHRFGASTVHWALCTHRTSIPYRRQGNGAETKQNS